MFKVYRINKNLKFILMPKFNLLEKKNAHIYSAGYDGKYNQRLLSSQIMWNAVSQEFPANLERKGWYNAPSAKFHATLQGNTRAKNVRWCLLQCTDVLSKRLTNTLVNLNTLIEKLYLCRGLLFCLRFSAFYFLKRSVLFKYFFVKTSAV